jgi:hypothetical protein
MEKENYQNPSYLLAISEAFVGDGVDQHPNPKHEQQQCKYRCNEHEKQPEESSYY